MSIILGIDPGLQHTGWGVIHKSQNILQFVAAGTISSCNKEDLNQRLHHVYLELVRIIKEYKPNEVALEKVFVNKNALSSLKLGHARGSIMLTISIMGLNISEYSAKYVKKAIVGNGNAEKEQVSRMVQIILPQAKTYSHDASDALAVAVCHANHQKFI